MTLRTPNNTAPTIYILLQQLLYTLLHFLFICMHMHTPEAIFFVDGFPHAVGRVSCVAREPLRVDAQVDVGQLTLIGVCDRERPMWHA